MLSSYREGALLKISRREFLGFTFGFATFSVIFSLTGSLPKRKLVRPPGALVEEEFLSMCIRCGVCVDVCPTRGLSLATLDDGIVNVGTPKLTGYCKINCLKCTEVCPTGALQRITVDEVDMGTSVIIKERCRGWKYGTCMRCFERCPNKAIYLTNSKSPMVDVSKCRGCGNCVDACPESPPAVYIVPEGANRIKLR